jgi:hypothetical protein
MFNPFFSHVIWEGTLPLLMCNHLITLLKKNILKKMLFFSSVKVTQAYSDTVRGVILATIWHSEPIHCHALRVLCNKEVTCSRQF